MSGTRAVAPVEEEVAFPRGGAQPLSALERKRLRQEGKTEAERDFLADGGKKKRQKGKTSHASHEDEDEDLAFAREASQGRLPKFVELLKFKGLSVGAKIWGAISSVTASELTVSLPDGLRGHIPAIEASDVLAELMRKNEATAQAAVEAGKKIPRLAPLPSLQALFEVGQYVRAVVTKLDSTTADTAGAKNSGKKKSSKRITLSLRVDRLNSGISGDALIDGLPLPACVRAVEDHGYTLTLGIKGVTGFLSKSDRDEGVGGEAPLMPGALVEGVITSAKDKRMVRVTTDKAAVASGVTHEWPGLTIGSLLPGSLVNARVRNVLSDGLIVSFLTYFNGTVDPFHLSQEDVAKDWKESYSEGQRLRARVIFVDPAAKRICLSLLPHLAKLELPSNLPALGSLVEDAVVRRVDGLLGVLLDLPSGGSGFAHISDVADERVEKLDKVLKRGQKVPARVIGSRPMDGLAVLSLKPSLVEQYLTGVGNIMPGDIVKGQVTAVDEKGLVLSLTKNTTAYVPNEHLSDLGVKQGKAKYKVGSKVTGRVLRANPVRRRITVTLQKALLGSKLTQLTSWEELKVGTKSHGTVCGVQNYGVFVAFYGDVKGLIHASELGLEAGETPEAAYHIGQVIKVRVVKVDLDHRRLSLGLATKKSKAMAEAEQLPLEPGEVLEGTVAAIVANREGGESPSGYRVELRSGDRLAGTGHLAAAHLADHSTAIAVLQACLKVGSPLGPVVVLDRPEGSKTPLLSRKASLVGNTDVLPKTLADVTPGLNVPGFVANVTDTSVFVRFLGGLTGRAGLAQLADTFVSDPHRIYSVGQSVRAQVLEVNEEAAQFSVTVKPSLVGGSKAALLQSLFKDLEFAEQIRAAADAEAGEAPVAWESLAVGSLSAVMVSRIEEYGVLCDLEADENPIGLVAPHQSEVEPAVGASIKGRILDVNKKDAIVDLTLKKDLLAGAPKSGKSLKGLKVGAKVDARVELVKDEYLVLSVPEHKHTIGFAAAEDLDAPSASVHKRFALGTLQPCTVAVLPSAETGGRLLLHLVPCEKPEKGAKGSKAKAKLEKLSAGTIVSGPIIDVQPLSVGVKLDKGYRGHIHITEASDIPSANPLEGLKVGQSVRAVVLGASPGLHGRPQHGVVELTLRESALTKADAGATQKLEARLNKDNVKLHSTVTGYVAQVEDDHLQVALSPQLTARLFVLDASDDLAVLKRFPDGYDVGQQITAHVIRVRKDFGEVDLALGEGIHKGTKCRVAATAEPGTVLNGRVIKAEGAGVRIQLGQHTYGIAALTDLHDAWVPNALANIQEGTFIKACVLENPGRKAAVKAQEQQPAKGKKKRKRTAEEEPKKSEGPIRLSLRRSRGGRVEAAGMLDAAAESLPEQEGEPLVDGEVVEKLDIRSLKEGQEVRGYVKAASKVGVFVALSHDIDARVRLSNLANTFVKDPEADFQVGQLVKGRILKVTPERVEMSLRKPNSTAGKALEILIPGQLVNGQVRRIQPYGVFVELQASGVTGMAHISECSDEFVRDITGLFKVGQGVRAKVLDVDLGTGRLKLGLKPSYFEDDDEAGTAGPEDDSAEPSTAEPDLDAEMLDAIDADSDDGADWRNAADGDEDGNADEEGDEDEGEEDDEEEEEDEQPKAIQPLGDLDAAMLGSEPQERKEEEEPLRKRRKATLAAASTAKEDAMKEASEEASEEPSESAEDDVQAAAMRPANGVKTPGHGAAIGKLLDEGVGWGDDEDDLQQPQATTGEPEAAMGPNKRQLKRAKEAQEAATRAAEMARLEGRAPESADDFERELMGSPNSSYLWLRYMAFLISLGEVPKARAVGERALSTIHFREEGEKFNVWVAWLNLEMHYGEPPEEAVMALFQRAQAYNNPKKIYLALVGILERANQEALLGQTFKAMERRFSQSAKVWLRHLAYLQRRDDSEGARRVLERATGILPARKHIKLLRQAALQEFKLGSPERGRNIFEGLLRNYPKRLDLWSIYIDQEVKQGDAARICSLFERATHLTLPAKKIKFLFKRFLEYERQHGTPATVDNVKQAAREYVEQHLAV